MRIGIFGGSFNPPHNMHKDIASYLLDHDFVDKVIFVPTGSKYKYKNNLLPDNIRYDMVKLITDKYDGMDVSDYELKDHVIYTCDTLNYFKTTNPTDDIYFICGTDNLSYIDEWKNGIYLLENYKFLIIRRETDDYNELKKKYEKYKDNFICVEGLDMNDLSSTNIRGNINNNKVKDYLDEDVYEYIVNNNLYEE